MTTQEPRPKPTDAGGGGYRGALPPKDDTLARNWVLVVIAIFALILVLAVLGVPSRFTPEPTSTPIPSVTPAASESAEPSTEPSASEEASEEPSAEATDSAPPSASAEPSG